MTFQEYILDGNNTGESYRASAHCRPGHFGGTETTGHQNFPTPPRTEDFLPPLERQETPLGYVQESVHEENLATVADRVDGAMSLEEVAGDTSEGPRTPNHQEGSLALNTPGANANYQSLSFVDRVGSPEHIIDRTNTQDLSQQGVLDNDSGYLIDYELPSAWVSELRTGNNETLGSLGLFGSY